MTTANPAYRETANSLADRQAAETAKSAAERARSMDAEIRHGDVASMASMQYAQDMLARARG